MVLVGSPIVYACSFFSSGIWWASVAVAALPGFDGPGSIPWHGPHPHLVALTPQ